jgi:hypothetical protein
MYDTVFTYDWIDAVTLGVWQSAVGGRDWHPVARVTVYEGDPYFCSVCVGCERVTTQRDVDLGEESDPDSPLFMGNAVNFACEWIEAIVTGRPLPTGGEC